MDLIFYNFVVLGFLFWFGFDSEAEEGRTELQFLILDPSTIPQNEQRTQLLFQTLKCFKPSDNLVVIKTFLVGLGGWLAGYRTMIQEICIQFTLSLQVSSADHLTSLGLSLL